MTAEIYAVTHASTSGAYTFQKFNNDLDPETRYLVTQGECNCPRGEMGKPCRHRRMLRQFLDEKHVGDGWMLNYNTSQWIEPIGDIGDAIEEQHPSPEPSLPAVAPPTVAQGVKGEGCTYGASYKRRI